MWKDFFYFSRTQKQGIIVLAIFICVVMLVGTRLSIHRSSQHSGKTDETFREEYNNFIASLKEADSIRMSRYPARETFEASHKRPTVILTSFDPNTVDSVTLCQLGLPAWMAKNILRYRAKGGIFRSPEDFKKIYGLTEEQYATLLPYIYIGDEYLKKDTIRLISEKINYTPDSLKSFKYPEGTVISLNPADTTELKKIPGIGSGIAKRIVNYRKQLGGYYHISQLEEIGINSKELAGWFKIENDETIRMNLNKVGIERLKAHPYFNFYQAKVIVEYRKKIKDIESLNQISFYDEFTPEDLKRMEHYVCFE